MMQVSSGGGEKKKGQKVKQDVRVDFTPMVDMMMLLITFFMLATSLSKPQTMEIAMPAKDKIAEEDQNEVKASEAITLYLGADHKVYYYEGLADLTTPNFLTETEFSADGLRNVLVERNRKVVDQVRELNTKKELNQVSKEDYETQLSELKSGKGTPVVIIKPMENSTYEDMIAALDEMLIASIGKYSIVDVDANDQTMLTNSGVAFK